MSRVLTLNNNGLLMWRLGPLGFYKQDMWDKAPEKKGMWAFPHPYYDSGYTGHQYTRLGPKKFRQRPDLHIPYGASLRYQDINLSTGPLDPKDVKLVPDPDYPSEYMLMGPLGPVRYSVPMGFYEDHMKWIREVGKKQLPIRKFYWKGDVYAHFNSSGEIVIDEWHRMSVRQYARLITKSRGVVMCKADYMSDDPLRNSRELIVGSYSHSHLEVFLSPKLGSFNGNIKSKISV